MRFIKLQTAILTLIILSAAAVFAQQETPTPTPEGDSQNTQTSSVEPKKEGVVRIGLIKPRVQLGQNSEQDIGESIRQLFVNYLNGAAIETVLIESKTPAQIGVEARQKECNFVLFSSVSQKQKNSIFGNLVKIAVPVLISSVPGTGNVGVQQGGISGAAQQSAQTMMNTVAESVKAKDVVVLDLNLSSLTNRSMFVKKELKAKASADGQDVLTPLIEQASEAIAETIIKK